MQKPMGESNRAIFDRIQSYLRKGWQPIPIPPWKKAPRQKNWTALRFSEGEIRQHFREEDNVGLLLGEPSGGLVDVDLDAPEAIELAAKILPPTSRRHGRAGKRESHRWYVAIPTPDPARFSDLDGASLVEIRSTGQHTLVPPSIHPTGERILWEEAGQPALVDGANLRRRVECLSACALVGRHWPATGARHHAAMALAGALLRNGWPEARVVKFIIFAAKCAGDEEWRERKNDVETTARRIEVGGRATGIPTLVGLLGTDAVDRLEDWLRLKNLKERNHQFSRVQKWPDALDPEALHGLAGDLVRTIEPHTESDPAALLFQLLTVFGNIVGRRPHFKAEADRHGMNLFVTIVGATSKGRKGSSWSHIRRIAEGVDREWAGQRIQQGLSSGEGLIWAVRDPIDKREPIKKGGRVVGYQKVTADFGINDKRLLVQEAEFASVLKMLDREGNTLSATLRQAWDTGMPRILTKNSPAQATGAHASMIGHITGDELRRYLTATEKGNGFANRILWVCARRSKSLPEGGNVEESELQDITSRIAQAVTFARSTEELQRSPKARKLWVEIYSELSAGSPGLLGAVTSRAEAQVIRLASIYALLECSNVIKEVHLRAALALWKYAEQSARFVFGDSLGDPVADQILRALRKSASGLTRTEIRDLFGRNRRADEIEPALASLAQCGLARPQADNEHGPGRPSEKWVAL
jgi:bifunctional DNA primase/polymerase-like protein